MIDINSISNYLLINNDCFSVLKDIPDHSIDLILTDPPYNIAKYSTGNIKFNWRREINNDLADWDLAKLDPFDLVAEFKRILKPNGNIFVFCSYNIIGEYHKAFDPEFDTESVNTSKKLKAVYQKIAIEQGTDFLAASDYAKPSPIDQEHLDEEGHRRLAEAVYHKLAKMQLGTGAA